MSANSAPRILADVNVWLATIVESHPHHGDAVAWWRRGAAGGSSAVFLCRVTQLGLLRLLGNVRVMGPSVCEPGRSWQLVNAIAAQGAIGYLDEPAGVEATLRRLTVTRARAPSLWTDAYLAAFAITAGLRLATFDRGFRRFSELDLEVLG